MTSKWVGGGEAAHVRCCPSCTALPPHSASSPVTPLCLAATRRWSAVSRAERYRKRLQENGEDTSLLDQDNPLPHFVDPITMSVVVRPAISPYGHVAGLATWKVGRAAARPSGCAARAVVLPWLAVGLGMLSVCRVHNRATPPRQCSLG
jgi:hypothetical protein